LSICDGSCWRIELVMIRSQARPEFDVFGASKIHFSGTEYIF
jgi:hypothetical protein